MANENSAREGVTEAARFRPSDVVLMPHVPLVGTMGRVEVEAAAGWMLLALREKGDFWGRVDPADCRAVREKHADSMTWIENPFLVPDFWDLVARGFAEFVGEGRGAPVRFTASGIEALAKWVPQDALQLRASLRAELEELAPERRAWIVELLHSGRDEDFAAAAVGVSPGVVYMITQAWNEADDLRGEVRHA
ncbi:MAG: hypothetical protein SangKO_010790 [Sandaracinaceae bacterium]